MDKNSLTKFFNEMLKSKFPFIKRIEISEESPIFDRTHRTLWVILSKYEDIYHEDEIRDYIDTVSKYTGVNIHNMKFAMDY